MPVPDSLAKIRSLDQQTVRHIQSAFETPSILDIVQELVKNSVEARATRITVNLYTTRHVDKIEVADNGCGIARESLRLLALHGCTSKASETARGNALASILAVSGGLQVRTKTDAMEAAQLLSLNTQGRVVENKPVAGEQGTSVSIKHPLVKLPVRYRIMGRQLNSITRDARLWLTRFCMANYQIHVAGNLMSFRAAKSLGEAVVSILGSKYQNNAVEIKSSKILDDACYEDVWVADHSISIPTTTLSGLLVSINGTICSSALTSKILPEWERKTNRFLGILNLQMPSKDLDLSCRQPVVKNQYRVEQIQAQIRKDLNPTSLLQWSMGHVRGLKSPVTLLNSKCQRITAAYSVPQAHWTIPANPEALKDLDILCQVRTDGTAIQSTSQVGYRVCFLYSKASGMVVAVDNRQDKPRILVTSI